MNAQLQHTESKTSDLKELTAVALPDNNEIANALTPYYQRLTELEATVEGFEVTDTESLADAERVVGAIKEVLKELKRDQEELSGPFRRLSRFIDSRFTFVRNRIATFDKMLKDSAAKFLVAERKREEARIAEERRLQEEAALALAEATTDEAQQEALLEMAIAVPTRKVAAPVTGSGMKSHTQDRWTAEVANLDAVIKAVAAGQLPIELFEVRKVVLNKIASDRKVEGEHHGLKIVKTTQARMR